MSQSSPQTPNANYTDWDSLTADIVLADDRGDSIVLPADPTALARFLNERRQLEARTAPKIQESES